MTALGTREVIGILTDNLRLRGSVLPVPARRATRWARELDLPRGGERVLYTGTMYHIVPYTERLVSLQQRLGGSRLAGLVPLARRMNRLVNGMPLVAWPTRAERAEYERVPANVARLLRRAGVEFGYLYEDDLYTGVLAYDLGAEDVAEPASASEEPPEDIGDTDEMDTEPEGMVQGEGADGKAQAESHKRDSDALLTGETTDWVWKLEKALERMTHLYHAADCQHEHRERRFSRWSMKRPIAPTGLLAAAAQRERDAQQPPSALDLLA